MERIWKSIMMLSNKDRYNLRKDFEYYSNSHFNDHAKAIKEGVKYHWLIYESQFNEGDWKNYLEKLVKETGFQYGQIQKQVECHILPIPDNKRRIEWGITVFGDQVTLCGYEPSRKTYKKSKITIEFGKDGTNVIGNSLKDLFDICPPINSQNKVLDLKINQKYDDLKDKLLGNLTKDYSKDVMIYHAEETISLTNWQLAIAIITLALVSISTILAGFSLGGHSSSDTTTNMTSHILNHSLNGSANK